ncbi:class I SAM-dependent methyltransferase [Altererythrobacter sp. MF3-039]|uniref:class I SAM-dependent methyltransferase n=1 Tax=Altererythrobacter sp. MF3-039 TaxID=3252901 RepID=UPI00390C91A0
MIELCCGMPAIEKLRGKVVPLATGRIFEIGCGGGLNQPFYDTNQVTEYCGIDPNERLLESARRRARENGWASEIKEGVGEDIPFASSSFDMVVCTYTLCSVQDHSRVISELKRILKPEGRLLFLEHGRSPDASVAKWQDRIEPIWKPVAGGCHLTRPIGPALRAARFAVEPLGQRYIPKTPKFAGWMEWGIAHKRH